MRALKAVAPFHRLLELTTDGMAVSPRRREKAVATRSESEHSARTTSALRKVCDSDSLAGM